MVTDKEEYWGNKMVAVHHLNGGIQPPLDKITYSILQRNIEVLYHIDTPIMYPL